MSTSVNRVAAKLVELERQVRGLSFTPQLAHSSIEGGGAVDVNDGEGNLVAVLGGQFDGSYMAASLSGPIPPVPVAPTLTPVEGGLTVTWSGLFANADMPTMDFSRVEIHVSTDPGFDATTADSLYSTIETPRGGSVTVRLEAVPQHVAFVARSLPGKSSAPSAVATATPLAVVTQAEIDAVTTASAAAQTAADNAQTAADAAAADASTAYTQAYDAWNLADSKAVIYYQTTAPTGNPSVPLNFGDLWFDTDDGYKPYVYRGASLGWTTVQDATIAAAQTTANSALTTASSKNKVYYQTAQPSTSGNTTGDLWFDTDDGYKCYVWNGSAWTLSRDSGIAAAQTTADGKNKTFYQTSAPSATAVGDLWFDTDDGYKCYRATATGTGSWVSVQDSAIATAQTAANNALTAANGKNKVTTSGTAPSSPAINDLWIDTANGNLIKVWNGTTWASYRDTTIATAQAAAVAAQTTADGKNKIFYQTAAPSTSGRLTGDLWFDTDDGYKPYVFNGTAWVVSQDALLLQTASLGTDLVVNGAGQMGDNTNFPGTTYTKSDAPTGSVGSFVTALGSAAYVILAASMPFNPDKKYRLSVGVRQTGTSTTACLYTGLSPYDAFGNAIATNHYMYSPGTATTLAAPLNPGDTTITLTSSANWYGTPGKNAGASSNLRSIIWWDYVDAGGKAWPVNTYSRNTSALDYWADGGITGNVITLRAPYSGPVRPSGTPLSNGATGSTYMYGGWVNNVPTSAWSSMSGSVTGTVSTGTSATFALGVPPGTAAVKIIFLPNRTPSGPPDANSQMAFSAVSFSDASAASYDANNITSVQITANAVTAPAIAANAVVAGKVAAGAVTAGTIVAGSITGDRLAANTITAAYIAADTITAAQIAASAITSSELAAGSVIAGKIAANAITANEIVANSITADRVAIGLGSNMVTDPRFLNPASWITVSGTSIDVGGGANGYNALKFVNSASQQAVYSNPQETIYTEGGSTYRLTIRIKSDVAIPAGSVTIGLRLRKSSDGTYVFYGASVPAQASAVTTFTSFDLGLITVGAFAGTMSLYVATQANLSTGNLWVDGLSWERATDGSLIVNGAVTANALAANSVIAGKIAAGAVTAGTIVAGSITGDRLAANTITAAYIAADTITAAQIATGGVTANEIAANAVVAGKIATDAVTAGTIAAGSITTAKLAAGAVTANEIAAATITSAKIAAGTITAANMVAGTITAASGIIGSIDAAKITVGLIQTNQLDAGVITAAKIASGAIDTSKLQATAIDGMTITGAIIRTAASGARWELSNTGYENTLRAYTASAGETSPGGLRADNATGGIVLESPLFGSGDIPAQLSVSNGPGASDSVINGYADGIFWGAESLASLSGGGGTSMVQCQPGDATTPGLILSGGAYATLGATKVEVYDTTSGAGVTVTDGNVSIDAPVTKMGGPTNKVETNDSTGSVTITATNVNINGKVANLDPTTWTGSTYTSTGAFDNYPTSGAQGTFVAPNSGKVRITVGGFIKAGTAGQPAQLGWDLRAGATIGSGTMVQAMANTNAVGNYNNQYVNATTSTIVTGLTPGDTYNLRHHFYCTVTGSVVTATTLTVEPMV